MNTTTMRLRRQACLGLHKAWMLALGLGVGVSVACRPESGGQSGTLSTGPAGRVCVRAQHDPEELAHLMQWAQHIVPEGQIVALTLEGERVDVPPGLDLSAMHWGPDEAQIGEEAPVCSPGWSEKFDLFRNALRVAASVEPSLSAVGREVLHPNIGGAKFILRLDDGVLHWAYLFMGRIVETGTGWARLREIYGREPGLGL